MKPTRTKYPYTTALRLAALAFTFIVSPCQAFYNPSTGRWLSRDPVEESGGVNISAFARNDTVGGVDFLGLDAPPCCGPHDPVGPGDPPRWCVPGPPRPPKPGDPY